MKTWRGRVAVLLVSWVAAGGMLQGCVSGSTYELAKRDAEKAMLLYQNEQHRTQELATASKQLKQQVEALQVTLKESQEKLERTDRDWREARDELLKLKIEREQQVVKGRSRRGEPASRIEAEKTPAPTAEVQAKPPTESEDAKRRVRELIQQLQTTLEHF